MEMQRCRSRDSQTRNVRSFETSQTLGGRWSVEETVVRTQFGRPKRV